MIGIVVSRFNEDVTRALLASCVETLKSRGISSSFIRVVHVPGAFEIPWAAQELALTKKFDVVIALGAVLKGETSQNDHISASTIRHLQTVGVRTRVPVILGVITPDTMERALARTTGDLDRGKEAALAAIEMMRLRHKLKSRAYLKEAGGG